MQSARQAQVVCHQWFPESFGHPRSMMEWHSWDEPTSQDRLPAWVQRGLTGSHSPHRADSLLTTYVWFLVSPSVTFPGSRDKDLSRDKFLTGSWPWPCPLFHLCYTIFNLPLCTLHPDLTLFPGAAESSGTTGPVHMLLFTLWIVLSPLTAPGSLRESFSAHSSLSPPVHSTELAFFPSHYYLSF